VRSSQEIRYGIPAATNTGKSAKERIPGRKKPEKVLAAGEGRARRNLQKLLDRRRGTSKRNPEKTGKRGFF
jgi:hypothetical protein